MRASSSIQAMNRACILYLLVHILSISVSHFSRDILIASMAGMFGLIVAGRLVQSDFVVASETEVVIEILDADSINHVVLFLTGSTPFPDGTGGAVYMRWPTVGGSSNWHFLGAISNGKPSCIFKVGKLSKESATSGGLFSNHAMSTSHGSAQLGVCVEDLQTLNDRIPPAGTAASQQSSFMELASKLARWVVHHAESYAVSVPNGDGRKMEVVPLAAIHTWYQIFERRFNQNPFFWRNLN